VDSRPPVRQRQSSRLAFHASRIVIDIGVLIVLGAMSLPFVTAASGDRSAIAADALPALLLVIPIFAVTMIPDHSRPLPAPLGWISLVLAVAALPYAAVKYLDAGNVANTIGGEVGMGARLLVFGTLVVVAGIVIGLARSLLRLPSGGLNPDPASARRAAPARRSPRGRRSQTAPPGTEGQPQHPGPAPEPAPAVRRVVPGDPAADPRRAARPAPRRTPPQQQQQPPQPQQPAAQPTPQRPRPDPAAPSSDAPLRGQQQERQQRVVPPRARRPMINLSPDQAALPKPKRPTGELPMASGEPDEERD